MKTTSQKLQQLNDNGYTMEQAITGYFYCAYNNEDGTQSPVWMDSACEDAYDMTSAIETAYDVVFG